MDAFLKTNRRRASAYVVSDNTGQHPVLVESRSSYTPLTGDKRTSGQQFKSTSRQNIKEYCTEASSVASNCKSNNYHITAENQYWLKMHLALQRTKEGLKEFVNEEMVAMQKSVYFNGQAICTECTTQNIVPCTRANCGQRCYWHDNENNTKSPRKCPNSICDRFKETIENAHRQKPGWKMTDATKWSLDTWQIAKCYVPYMFKTSTSASEADLSELLNIIINNRRFQNKFAGNLDDDQNLFKKVRGIRNAMCHPKSDCMTKEEFYSNIEQLICLLSDGKYLACHQPAVEAVKQLRELMERPLVENEQGRARKELQQQYEEDKRRLQCHLAEQYLNTSSKIPLSVMVSNITADLDDVFAPQAMKQVKLLHETEHESRKLQLSNVNSYSDIFTRHSNPCKNIYIEGETGVGKSLLCQRMAQSWAKCIVNSQTQNEDNYIKKFQFLFYVPLKYVQLENTLDGMIFNHQLLQCKRHKSLIEKILQEESDSCLILMDGLDEWTSTMTTATMGISYGLPIRNITRQCTILTTTRPWKLEMIRMASTEMDQLVELTGLNEHSSRKYISSLVSCLNRKFGKKMFDFEFIEMLQSNNLQHFQTLPMILKHLVCIWHGKKTIGNSQVQIYSAMLNFLLQMPGKESSIRYKAMNPLKQNVTSNALPPCFKGKQSCQQFGPLLKSLSKLSFYTLFGETHMSSLVFNSSTAEDHGMTTEEIQACLYVGILSQEIVLEHCAEEQKQLSFMHKTFQEFFAAMYIYFVPGEIENIYKTVCNLCNSIERILEMSRVFVFISGMCPNAMIRLSRHVAWIVSKHEQVQTFRRSFDVSSSICRSVQNLMTACVAEASYNGQSQDRTIYIHDIVEGHYNVESDEYTAVMEHVEHLARSSNGHLKSLQIKDKKKLILLQHVSANRVLEKLQVKMHNLCGTLFSCLVNVIDQSHASLRCLDLEQCTFSELPKECVPDIFHNIHHLESIRLCQTVLNNKQFINLLLCLSNKQGLRQIHLTRLVIKPATLSMECKTNFGRLDLAAHSELNTLELKSLQIESIQMPTNCNQLRKVELSQLKVDFIQMPNNCPQLNTFKLSELQCADMFMPTNCPQLDTIEMSTLRACRIQMPTICDQLNILKLSELKADSIRMPTHCPELSTFELFNLTVDSVQMLQSCTKLVSINMTGLRINCVQLPAYCPQLKIFKLSKTDAGQIQMPTDCPQLKVIEIAWSHAGKIMMPAACPLLDTLKIEALRVDHTFTHMTVRNLPLKVCELVGIHPPDATLALLDLLRDNTQLQHLRVKPRDHKTSEITDLVMDTLPTLPCVRRVKLDTLHIVGRKLSLSPKMVSLEEIELCHVTLSYESVRNFVYDLPKTQHSLKVNMTDVAIVPEEDKRKALDFIISSARLIVTANTSDESALNLDFHTHFQTRL